MNAGPAPRLRPIRPADDAQMAAIIRQVMTEFSACGQGFAIHDAEVTAMSAAYAAQRSAYFVWEVSELPARVLGGAGIGPLAGAGPEVCELRKMYFLPEARGRGLGAALLARCLQAARELGYRRCYLETLTGMDQAQRLYERAGFQRLPGPCGATGHFGCDRWYALELAPPAGPRP
ncbi:MAG: GNAT family N-acetyltransferase [Planctomycetota bacterium]